MVSTHISTFIIKLTEALIYKEFETWTLIDYIVKMLVCSTWGVRSYTHHTDILEIHVHLFYKCTLIWQLSYYIETGVPNCFILWPLFHITIHRSGFSAAPSILSIVSLTICKSMCVCIYNEPIQCKLRLIT